MMKPLIKTFLPVLALAVTLPLSAQEPASARESAPFDLSGQWVSLVTEDWRFRMLAAPAGDYEGINLTPAGQAIADSWDPAADEAAGEACRAYGAGGLMRMPTRLRIGWEGDDVLRLDTDAGMQTRLLNFGPPGAEEGGGGWQGVSRASWQLERAGGFGAPVVSGSLEVNTRDMRPGYFRRNGLPYGESATLTEHFELLRHEGSGNEYLVVIAILEDPEHLAQPVITSSNFKREEGTGGWNPTPCRVE